MIEVVEDVVVKENSPDENFDGDDLVVGTDEDETTSRTYIRFNEESFDDGVFLIIFLLFKLASKCVPKYWFMLSGTLHLRFQRNTTLMTSQKPGFTSHLMTFHLDLRMTVLHKPSSSRL